MNRTLAIALASAAVVGTTAGGVAATQLTGSRSGDTPAAGRTTTPSVSPSASGSTPSSPAESADAGGAPAVLWATQRELHDGDQEVAINLRDEPMELHRVDGGWLVTTKRSPQEPAFDVSVVTPDGEVTFLTETFGWGDVSPDGTRYVAMRLDGSGYGIWDVSTGEEVELVDRGVEREHVPAGRAAFADGGATIVAEWLDDDGEPEIVATRVGSHESEVVTDDLVGPWNVSADGTWLAGTSDDAEEGDNPACIELRRTSDPEGETVDCTLAFSGTPSFSPDETRVLATVAPLDGFGPGAFQVVDLDKRTPVAMVDAPDATLDGAMLDDRHVVLLGAANLDGDETVIRVCDLGGGCEEVGRSTDSAYTAVLGSTD